MGALTCIRIKENAWLEAFFFSNRCAWQRRLHEESSHSNYDSCLNRPNLLPGGLSCCIRCLIQGSRCASVIGPSLRLGIRGIGILAAARCGQCQHSACSSQTDPPTAASSSWVVLLFCQYNLSSLLYIVNGFPEDVKGNQDVFPQCAWRYTFQGAGTVKLV